MDNLNNVYKEEYGRGLFDPNEIKNMKDVREWLCELHTLVLRMHSDVWAMKNRKPWWKRLFR